MMEFESNMNNAFAPLIDFAGKENKVDGFMYMGTFIQDNARIHLFKHFITRDYLNIDENGTFYSYTGTPYNSQYTPISKEDALSPFKMGGDE